MGKVVLCFRAKNLTFSSCWVVTKKAPFQQFLSEISPKVPTKSVLWALVLISQMPIPCTLGDGLGIGWVALFEILSIKSNVFLVSRDS